MRRNILAAPALVAAAATALLAAAAPVLAIEGHRPIFQRTDIFEPGYYKFTRNVASGGSPIITVSVGPEDRVVIDLNCFTATQLSTNVPVIFISSGGNIVIKNGELRNGTHGIEVFPGFTDSLTVNDMVIGNSFIDGISAGGLNSFNARNVNVSLTGDDGIDLDDTRNVDMDDMLMGDAGNDNIDIDGGVAGTTARIERLTAKNAGQNGVNLNNVDFITLQDTSVSGSAGDGLNINQVNGGKFAGLSVSGSGGHGINVTGSDFLEFDNFMVTGSTGTGINLDGFSNDLFLDLGSISGNDKGVVINSDRTTLRGVKVTGSAQEGVHVTASADTTVVRDSTSIGNVVWDLLVEGINTLTFQNLIGTTGP